MIYHKKYNTINYQIKNVINDNLFSINDIYVCDIYNNNKYIGYFIYKIINNNIIIDFIYNSLVYNITQTFNKNKYDNIIIQVSIILSVVNIYIILAEKAYNIPTNIKKGPIIIKSKNKITYYKQIILT
jgi:hypothetical protein